jgi:hypothetical protein
MAKRQNNSSADIDWYLVSIARLKQIGLIVLVVVIAALVALLYLNRARDPRERALNRIQDAQRSLNDLAASKDFSSFRTEFERGQGKLTDARQLFSRGTWNEAESAAIESQTIVKSALARLPGANESDAQFLSVEGEVRYQKGSGGDFQRADVRTPLSNGDWVKTGASSSAELIFSNGSLYTIGSNALLEIHSAINPKTSKKENTVQMQVGAVEVNTSEEGSAIATPGSRVVVSPASTAHVGVDAVQTTQVLSLKGSASIQPKTGGTAVQVSGGEQVRATVDGAISEVARFVPPPALAAPADNHIFQGAADSTIVLSWSPQPGAVAYQLQVSRSRLFSGVEINARRTSTSATTRATSEGSFYWRVASVDAEGRVGAFSTHRRFRVTGLGTLAQPGGDTDTIPPSLQLNRPLNFGGQYYMVEGRAEPGASVFVNDEEIDVQSDGSFKKLVTFPAVGWNAIIVKAVDSAGNQTVRNEKVLVEE